MKAMIKMGKCSLVLILLAVILIVSGCSANIASNNALPADDGAKEITVTVKYDGGEFKQAAEIFQKETGIKVNLVSYDGITSKEEEDEYNKKIIADLMAGKGADIYVEYDLSYYPQKYMCDMTKWVDQDAEIDKNEYFKGILNSNRVEGKMYALPIGFLMQILSTQTTVPELEGQDCLTWEQFFEKTKNIKRRGTLFGLPDLEVFMRRFGERSAEFIDEKNKTQKLDTPEFIWLLEQCKAWGEQGLCGKYEKWKTQNYGEAFFTVFTTNVTSDICRINGSSDYYSYDIPSDGKTGNSNRIVIAPLVCINSNSKCKSTAWRFIKFILSEKIQLTLSIMPLNRKAAEKKLAEELYLYINSQDIEKVKKDIINNLDAIEKASLYVPLPTYGKIIEAEARRYYLGEVSAEKAAKSMATKVELYLKEQN